MKRILVLYAHLVLFAAVASAQAPLATTQKWMKGWDNFSEPLNLTKSSVVWSLNSTTKKISVAVNLVGATPGKLYQVALNFFCTTFPATFGQFPNDTSGGGACIPATRQGVTATIAEVEIGVIATDIHGNGKYSVIIGPVASGTYELEFFVRIITERVASSSMAGLAIQTHADADFQSPGPFGTGITTITVP